MNYTRHKDHITCADCGANLDYGERCDCQIVQWYREEDTNNLIVEYKGRIFTFNHTQLMLQMSKPENRDISFEDFFKHLCMVEMATSQK